MLLKKEFYYIRHGQTDWNREGRLQGYTDIPLNETGRAQAYAAAEAAKGIEVATICASPLARALETAQILQRAVGGEIEVIEDLKECCFGEREGQLGEEWFADWQEGLYTPKGGESFPTFIARATKAINDALTRPGPVLIAAHGGLYWAIQQHAGLEQSMTLGNCTLMHHTPPIAPGSTWQVRAL